MSAPLSSRPVAKGPRRRYREATREELQHAVLRVANKGGKLSISAVAADAGVSPGLIHNTYPDIAEKIRGMMGKATRRQRDEIAVELANAKAALRELRSQLDRAHADMANLAYLNQSLREEVETLSASTGTNVVVLPSQRDC